MAYRDSGSIARQGIALVVVPIAVLVLVAWMLLSALGSAMAEVRCVSTPDSPMETCDDDDRTPHD